MITLLSQKIVRVDPWLPSTNAHVLLRRPHETSAVGSFLDAEEHAEESVGQLLVATDRSTVEPPERGEDEAAGIELDHGWEIAHVALFV